MSAMALGWQGVPAMALGRRFVPALALGWRACDGFGVAGGEAWVRRR